MKLICLYYSYKWHATENLKITKRTIKFSFRHNYICIYFHTQNKNKQDYSIVYLKKDTSPWTAINLCSIPHWWRGVKGIIFWNCFQNATKRVMFALWQLREFRCFALNRHKYSFQRTCFINYLLHHFVNIKQFNFGFEFNALKKKSIENTNNLYIDKLLFNYWLKIQCTCIHVFIIHYMFYCACLRNTA